MRMSIAPQPSEAACRSAAAIIWRPRPRPCCAGLDGQHAEVQAIAALLEIHARVRGRAAVAIDDEERPGRHVARDLCGADVRSLVDEVALHRERRVQQRHDPEHVLSVGNS